MSKSENKGRRMEEGVQAAGGRAAAALLLLLLLLLLFLPGCPSPGLRAEGWASPRVAGSLIAAGCLFAPPRLTRRCLLTCRPAGPWKLAWVRRGFDPRATPRARGYQCLEYHLPTDW